MPERAVQQPALDWLGEDPVHRTLLTANRRLARELRNEYDQSMLRAGHVAWQTPSLQSWSSWVSQLCQASEVTAGATLAPAAARVVWRQVAERHAAPNVLSVEGLARLGQEAWQLLCDWCVPLDDLRRSARNRDEHVFCRMLDDYLAALQDKGWVDGNQLLLKACQVIDNGRIALPTRVRLEGFDRFVPAVRRVLNALEAGGCRVDRGQTAFAEASINRVACADEDAELRSAGAWAREQIIRAPDARVAIVVTGLEHDASRVERLVREGFSPGWQLGDAQHRDVVETSYGRRLADYPAIAAALLLLRLAATGLRSADVAVLCRAPGLKSSSPAAWAEIEQRLRQLPERSWFPRELIDALLSVDTANTASDWFELLRAASDLSERRLRVAPISAWADEIDQLLEAAGWPGQGSLDSELFQLVNRWRQALNELTSLDAVLGPISFVGAIAELTRLLGESIYQPEQSAGRLRVMGPLEAAGMQFDALLVARTDASRWPGRRGPHPLLARELQRAFGMPDATPADTLEYSRRVLRRLAGSAPQIRFTWAVQQGDETIGGSSLLAELGSDSDPAARRDLRTADPGWYAAALAGSETLEHSTADSAPPITARETLYGGVRVVSLQRVNPIYAFAVGRLATRTLQPFEPGVTPPRRGVLLHDALDRLYQDKPDRDTIAAWSGEERADRVNRSIRAALGRFLANADDVTRRLLRLEARRSEALLHELIAMDAEREFFRIECVEERHELVHEGAVLDLRADRIDRLDSGGYFIVDYKTGAARGLVKRSGEPDELQLVLYAAALQKPVEGLGRWFVNARDVSLLGAGQAVVKKPAEPGAWSQQLEEWTVLALGLLADVAAGDVRVNVIDTAHRDWQLDVLTRVAELRRDG